MTTKINAKLILASKNAHTGDILYTWVLTYPRFILAEVLTHRTFSRNTSSSRAIPSRKQRKKVMVDPFVPVYIGANKKGMQAGEELTGWRRSAAEKVWKLARLPQVAAAWGLESLGVHKQIANRLLEPWVWVEQIASATEVDNFLWLRDHHMAEPHFQELARQMHAQVRYARYMLSGSGYDYDRETDEQLSCPGIGDVQILRNGDWHLPFIGDDDRLRLGYDGLKKVSAARCARVSYLLPETGERSTFERDIELFERLAVSVPKHLSPLEHQATPVESGEYCGNFKGWRQFRKDIIGEAGPQQS